MISCRECLTAVSTGSYSDMQPDTEVGVHCSTCPDCSRVVTQVRDRERRFAASLEELRMTTAPSEVAQSAIASQRMLKARIWRGLLFGALMATLSVAVVDWAIPAYERAVPITFGEGTVTETIPLSCITPRQASDLATPFLRSKSPAVYTARDIQAVTLRGVKGELLQAKAAIHDFDIKCQLPRTSTPKP